MSDTPVPPLFHVRLPAWYTVKDTLRLFVCPQTYAFLFNRVPHVTTAQKIFLLWRFVVVSFALECEHRNCEMLSIARRFLSLPDSVSGVIVEAGVYKGGSAVKLSLVAAFSGRRLSLFDSFKGIPANTEVHTYYDKRDPSFFHQGAYTGRLAEVKQNIKRFGDLSVVDIHKGWFKDTLPLFHAPVAAVFLDVDLASSTRECLTYLHPLLSKGGICFSHDGHLRMVIDVFRDRQFWRNVLHSHRPAVAGLGKRNLIMYKKTGRLGAHPKATS